jgi:hypothetical protein
MGYIQQSNIKKIYAYLTQLGKEKIISGDTIDFQVKYFSLHDEDINYIIASKTSGTTYNIPKSGFIPDITGDDNICLPNISDATFLEKNKLVGIIVPPTPQPPNPTQITATIVGTCSTDGETFQINVTNTQGGTGQGYYWYVKIDEISFPSATATLLEAILIKSTQSEDYQVNTPKSFKATFKFSDTYLPRKSDSYNYTVYVGDSSGTEVELQKFTDINCSKRIYGWTPYQQDVTSDYPNGLNLITEDNLIDIPNMPSVKIGYAAFVIDNGNRRRDLNITDEDLDKINTYTNTILNNITYDQNCQYNTRPAFYSVPINFKAVRDIQSNVGQSSEAIRTNGIIIRTQAEGPNAWFDNVGGTSLLPSSIYTNSSYIPYKNNFDLLHPTVEPFADMGLNGFQIQYVEVAPKNDPFTPSNPNGGTSQYGSRETSGFYRAAWDGQPPPTDKYVFYPPQLGNYTYLPYNEFNVSWYIYTNLPC